MTHGRLITTFGLIAVLAVPSFAAAQPRGRSERGVRRGGDEQRGERRGRAVPRRSVRVVRPQVVRVAPYYYRGYGPRLGLGFYSGYGGYYGRPYGFAYPAYGYGGYGYPGYGYPAYGYPGYAVAVRPYGGVRIDLPARDAEVHVDGYFVGIVDDFDGVFQQVNLEPGPHRIEVRAPGFETMAFDVNVEPNRTITYRAGMRPLQP